MCQTIAQLDGGVVADVQPAGNFRDRRVNVFRQALQCEQQLMVLRIDAIGASRLFAEMQEAPDLVAEFGERAVIVRAQIVFGHDRDYRPLHRWVLDA